MKLIRFIAIIVAATLLMPLAVHAQDAREQLITQQCKELAGLLDGLQRRDLVSRTNLGHEYEATAKLLGAFTQRVRNNNMAAQPYEQLLAQFEIATTQFREAYVHYDDSITALKQINCQTEPAKFDAQLVQTRILRDTTEGASTHAAAIVGQFRDMMASLQAELPTQPAKVGN